MAELTPPVDMAGAAVVIEMDEHSLGSITVNGNEIIDIVKAFHIHASKGAAPLLVLEISDFRMENTMTLSHSKLSWRKG